MNNCPVCNGPMQALLTSTFCPKDCDRPKAVKPSTVEVFRTKASDEVKEWVRGYAGAWVAAKSPVEEFNALLRHYGNSYLTSKIAPLLPPTADCLYGCRTLYKGQWYEVENRNYWKRELSLPSVSDRDWVNTTINTVNSLICEVQSDLLPATKGYSEILTLGGLPHWVENDGHIAVRSADSDTVTIRLRAFWAGVSNAT